MGYRGNKNNPIIQIDNKELGKQLAEKATKDEVALKADKTEVQAVASGSPKGVYATQSALQAAFPTGNSNIYLVTGNVKEVDTLSITAAPTAAGNITVTLNGVATNIAVTSGVKEVASLTVTAVPTVAGNVTITLNGVATTVALDPATDTTTDLVATKIRNATYSTGAVTGGTASTVTFTAAAVGVKTDAIYSAGSTGATGTMSTTTQGVDADTTTSVATKIRGTSFAGWTTGGTGTTVTFTATAGGTKTAPSYSAGTTGAAGTMSVTTAGVNADGNWYYWNGSAWTAGGTYQSTGIADGIITQKQISFPVVKGNPSKNLFDKSTVTPNSYIDGNGNVVANTGWYASDFIPVQPNTAYYKNVNNSAAFYNSSKVFISPLTTSGVKAITSPANAAYVRITIPTGIDINTIQLELGSIGTSYEAFGPKLDPNTITNGSLMQSMLNFTPLIGMPSKNLFDKSKATSGKYIDYATGNLATNASYYASDYIPVQPNTTYTKTSTQQWAYYDTNKTFISGVSSGSTFTTPANATYVRLSVDSNLIDTYQLELGSTKTSYDSFNVKVNPNNLPSASKSEYGNVLTVAKSGASFTKIADAVAAASDTATTPVTIWIMPGTYVETIDLRGRYITLAGINRQTCIIKTFTNDYHNPPVNLSASSNLYDLTIIADDDGTTTPPGGVGGLSAYAVHHDIAGYFGDYPAPKYQGTARARNCTLISKHTSAVGIGLATYQTLIWEDCEFISYDANSSAFRAHNYMNSGATNQALIVDNCRIHNMNGFTPLTLQDPNNSQASGGKDNRDTVFSFRNNIIWNDVNGKNITLGTDMAPQAGCIVGYVKLGKDSFGNSLPELNA